MATAALRGPRNVDHYRDTSLDDLIGNDNRYPRVGLQNRTNSLTSQSRRSVSETDSLNMNAPAAPHPPEGASMSYSRAPEETTIPQRSFSQRAKTRPFLREAIADDELTKDITVESRRHPGSDQVRHDQHPINPGRPHVIQAPLQVNTGVTDRRPFSNSALPGSSKYSPDRPIRAAGHQRQVSEPMRQYDEPISTISRGTAGRHTSNAMSADLRKDRAPERSPLQKLEVSLKDITKEEKRARVAEAETLLRESKTGRKGRVTSQAVTSKSATTPVKQNSLRGLPHPDMVRDHDHIDSAHNLTTVQPEHPQNQRPTNFNRPDRRRSSADGRGSFEYNGQDAVPPRRPAKDFYNKAAGEGNQRSSSQQGPEPERPDFAGNVPVEPYQMKDNAYNGSGQASYKSASGNQHTQNSQEMSSRSIQNKCALSPIEHHPSRFHARWEAACPVQGRTRHFENQIFDQRHEQFTQSGANGWCCGRGCSGRYGNHNLAHGIEKATESTSAWVRWEYAGTG